MSWQCRAYGYWDYVNGEGEILATVTEGYRCWEFNGRQFVDLSSAKRAAEKAYVENAL